MPRTGAPEVARSLREPLAASRSHDARGAGNVLGGSNAA
jgi:hypothetical protein